jgi:AcrR family transcriptional regulator
MARSASPPRTIGPVPRARRVPGHSVDAPTPSGARQASVLDAFVREALLCGSIEGVGIRAVCARAGCSAPVVYRLFGDRSGLVRAAVRSTHLRLLAEVDAAVRAPGPAIQRLRSVAEPYLRRASGDAEAFETLVTAECRSDDVLASAVRTVYTRFARLLEELLREGVAGGELRRDIDPVFVAWRLIDLGLFRSQARLMRLGEPDRIRYPERAFAALLSEIEA